MKIPISQKNYITLASSREACLKSLIDSGGNILVDNAGYVTVGMPNLSFSGTEYAPVIQFYKNKIFKVIYYFDRQELGTSNIQEAIQKIEQVTGGEVGKTYDWGYVEYIFDLRDETDSVIFSFN